MSEQPLALRLADELFANYGHTDLDDRVTAELRRQHSEIEQLKAEREVLRIAIRFLFDHGAYLTERVPDHLQAAIDAARSET